jgi:outer membrane protein assembly factor BamE (lipoprotein component of BamABCDE complex)
MKKSVCAVVFLAAAVILSSCSIYTCPTYAKQPVKNVNRDVKASRI